MDLSLQYNFVTELTSLIVVADKNFTVDDNGNDGQNLELDPTLAFTPTRQDIASKSEANFTTEITRITCTFGVSIQSLNIRP